MILRRLLFWVPPTAITAFAAFLAAAQMTATGGFGLVDGVLLVLLALSSGYVTFQSWQVVLGLFHRAARPAPVPPGLVAPDFRRLAVVMPICDEDVAAVFGALAVMRRSMARAGLGEAEIHVLSDTREAGTVTAERAAFAAAAAGACAPGSLPALRYRHRPVNTRRKAGNVAEFCDRHGGDFELMLVLDADSLMSGDTIRRMAETMFAEARLGLVQTLCFPARRTTLFARIQQWGARLYAPLHTAGMAFWTGDDGIYWGHNAMIRVAPFHAHCQLPLLPGRPPLGGEILCHDVVEAAFLRRAGWEVRILPDLGGTWEDMPSNTLDFAARDRRWCQGNLQHVRLLLRQGFSRGMLYHLVNGIFAYVSAPIWMLFLVVGTLQYAFSPAVSQAQATILAPAVAAPVLFWLSLAVIFLPKILSLGVALLDGARRRAFGGAGPLLSSAVAETLFGLLWSQMSLLFYTHFVIGILSGRAVSWDPQARDDRGISWREAWSRHRGHVLVALLWGVAVWHLNPTVFWWMSPLYLGLGLSPVITVLTSRSNIGLAARRLGLFLTPDETAPAPELAELPAEIGRVNALLGAERPEPLAMRGAEPAIA